MEPHAPLEPRLSRRIYSNDKIELESLDCFNAPLERRMISNNKIEIEYIIPCHEQQTLQLTPKDSTSTCRIKENERNIVIVDPPSASGADNIYRRSSISSVLRNFNVSPLSLISRRKAMM